MYRAAICQNGKNSLGDLPVITEWHQIAPGKPMQNRVVCGGASVAALVMNASEAPFSTPTHARIEITAWKEDYNRNRPHSSLGNITPYKSQ